MWQSVHWCSVNQNSLGTSLGYNVLNKFYWQLKSQLMQLRKQKPENFRIAGIQTLTSAVSKTTNNFETVNVEVA